MMILKLVSRLVAIIFLVSAMMVLMRAQNQPCPDGVPPCYTDTNPLPGHGGASSLPTNPANPNDPKYTPCGCADDNRRIITVKIDSSWNVDAAGNPTPNQTNPNVYSAVQCAINLWNQAADGSGHKTGYYFVLDQGGTVSPGTADLTVVNNRPLRGFASVLPTTGNPPNWTRYRVNVDPQHRDLYGGKRRPADLCGTITHEIGHTLGLSHNMNVPPCPSIMTPSPTNGRRPNENNAVTPTDIVMVNRHLANSSQNCTAYMRRRADSDGGGDSGGGNNGGGTNCEYNSYSYNQNPRYNEENQFCVDVYIVTNYVCDGQIVSSSTEYVGTSCR